MKSGSPSIFLIHKLSASPLHPRRSFRLHVSSSPILAFCLWRHSRLINIVFWCVDLDLKLWNHFVPVSNIHFYASLEFWLLKSLLVVRNEIACIFPKNWFWMHICSFITDRSPTTVVYLLIWLAWTLPCLGFLMISATWTFFPADHLTLSLYFIWGLDRKAAMRWGRPNWLLQCTTESVRQCIIINEWGIFWIPAGMNCDISRA